MSDKKRTGMRVFERGSERYEIHTEAWAEILLMLEDWRWEPQQPMTVNYLAGNVHISDADAGALAHIGQKILDAALADPMSVYPLRVDMARLYEVTEFCKSGGFRICL
jgi:hypothetical protein